MGIGKATILVGGTGFIGSALVAELVRRGEKVISVSRNLPEKQEVGIEYHAFDIAAQPERLAEIFGIGNTIFLLTGQNYTGFDAEKEKDIFSRILDKVKVSSPEKVLFTSSALVYGDCDAPASENYPIHPKEPYSIFKAECEKMIEEKLAGIPVGILRLANVYGSEKNKGFIGLVFKKALEVSAIRVNGDGLQKRDYVFLDDVVLSMIAVRDNLHETDRVNISTGKSETLIEVIDAISEVTGKNIPYEITGVLVDEVANSLVDNRKLAEKYGYMPRTSLNDGLKETWKRYESMGMEPILDHPHPPFIVTR